MRESLAPAPSFRAGAFWAIRARATRLAKRLLDLAASVVALILLSPLLVTAAALIRLTTPGPALFRQTRVGRNQRSFVLYKFRTMHDGCSDSPHREYVSALLTDDNPSNGRGARLLQAGKRCADHAARSAAAPGQYRRASAAAERDPGGDVPGRAAPRPSLGG